MQNGIIIIILIAVVTLALLHFRNHFRGGCCGSGSKTIRSHKKLDQPILGKKELTIEGMHCKNCQARVENAINRCHGVACHVDLRRKIATVSYCQPISDDELTHIIEKLGYHVTAIREI